MRAWLLENTNWVQGKQYVIVPKAEGTHCPALIQIDMTINGEALQGTMDDPGVCKKCDTRYCEHHKDRVMKWLNKFLNDD